MAATQAMRNMAIEVLPDMVTLVPERREELTTEGGLDVVANQEFIEETINMLHASNIVVSLFIDPAIEQIKAATRAGADYVELHTGKFANADDESIYIEELEKIRSMALAASKLGLRVSAGHGLNYQNVRDVSKIPQLEELNIGHAIVAKSIMVGLERAIREMVELIR
jgi:pyridoxine 5-phosphate synthase